MNKQKTDDFINFAKTKLQEKTEALKAIDTKNQEKLKPLLDRIQALQREYREKSVINNTPERQAVSNEIKVLNALIDEYENPGKVKEEKVIKRRAPRKKE
jgi:hypothetical protein